MKKYRYQKILRKPNSSVGFFEEHLAVHGQLDKRRVFLDMLEQLRQIYQRNPSYQEISTESEQLVQADYTHEELEEIIRQSRQMSEQCMEIHNEWVRHVMENNIYYSTTVREIAQ